MVYLKSDLLAKSINDKWDILNDIEDKKCISSIDLTALEYLSWDEDDKIRNRVAEILVGSASKESEDILVRLLKDKDSLVRANAADSLCISTSLEVLDLLKKRLLKDKSILVRGYSALSILDIATNTKQDINKLSNFFKGVLKKEKRIWVKLNLYEVLYLCGEEVYLNNLISELNNRYFTNRVATVASLHNITSNKNKLIIKTAILERLKIETVHLVKRKIENILQQMDIETN